MVFGMWWVQLNMCGFVSKHENKEKCVELFEGGPIAITEMGGMLIIGLKEK